MDIQAILDRINGWRASGKTLCISLYQYTHRALPDKANDPIRYKNLVSQIEKTLASEYPGIDFRAVMEPFHRLEDDREFWNHVREGLAIFGGDGLFEVHVLPRRVPERAVVAGSFHTKPLLRISQSADTYQVLALTRDSVKLYEGNRNGLDEVPLHEEVPATLTDALGTEKTDPHITAAAYRVGAPKSAGGSSAPSAFHGHGGRKDQIGVDMERFFRAVDRPILEHHSRPERLPLILAALPDNQAEFRKVSHNPFLVERGVDADPGSLSIEELCERAWQAMEPVYTRRIEDLSSRYALALSSLRGTDDLEAAAKACAMGRIETLLVERDREIPGHIEPGTGAVTLGEGGRAPADDLLDDLAELTLQRGGEVLVLPADQMPTNTGLAAMFRF